MSRISAFLLLCLIAAITGCKPNTNPAPQPMSNGSEVPKTIARIETEYFSITHPKGWVQGRIQRSKTKVILASGSRPEKNPNGIIKVDVGLPVDSDARETANHFAAMGASNAEVISTYLDGVEAFEVRATGNGLESPQRVIVAMYEGRIFLLMAASEKNVDSIDPFEQIRDSWKWTVPSGN